jgi:hypothetical protein
MHEILNDENNDKNDIIGIDKNKLTNEKDLYPNKLNIIIFTNISDESIDYNPKMSYPSTTSSNVYFTPFVKLTVNDLLSNVALLSNSAELPKKSFDIFFNEKNFNELLQKKIDQSNENFLKIKDSCDNKVIDNNIKNILNILFKSGNLFYIKDNPYTINNYEWTTGDWFIYSSELDKKTKNTYDDILKRNKVEDNKETKIEKQTKQDFEIISEITPNCLKGDAPISLIDSENKKKMYAQKMNILTNNKFFSKENIDQIFSEYKENYSNIFDRYLCFNLNDQIPSFDKDPLTISLLYIGNNFIKDIETYPILSKFYDSLNTNANELNEIINQLNNIVTTNNLLVINNNSENNLFFQKVLDYNKELIPILSKLKKKFEDKIKSEQFRKSWYESQLNEIRTIINYFNELNNIFKIIADDKTKIKNITKSLTPQKQKEIVKYFDVIIKTINKINTNIPNNTNRMSGYISSSDIMISYSSVKEKFTQKIKELDTIISTFKKNLDKIDSNTNEFYNKFKLNKNKELPADFIKNKIDFFKTCKKVYSLIKQKLISQNNYLNKLFVFYKKLYDLKKDEYKKIISSNIFTSFKNADNIRLQLSIRIILFDVIIYNTLIYDKCYRNAYNLYLKNIDIVIKKLEEIETKKFNLKDETKNSKEDENTEIINLFKDYYYYIFFINFNLDKIMWDIISKKTLDIKNKFKSFISKSINEYSKYINLFQDTHDSIFGKVQQVFVDLYNLDFSNFSEQESMKIICYELINLFSKLNMITLYRSYKTNTINYFVCNNLSKKITYYEKKNIIYTFNEIYFIYDFNKLKLDNPNDTTCITFPNKDCNVLNNVCYNDYKSSIELITPSITNEDLNKLCNSINKTEEYDEITNISIQNDFKEKNKYFGFPLYTLFNDLFNVDIKQRQSNNLNSYIQVNNFGTIIYGIYNGNNLLKTIIDSITWDLALKNYKFLYNEECANLDNGDKNNNNEYKLNIISFFYENYKLNIIIIRKTREGYKIIQNINDKIDENYPYIYILNQSIKQESDLENNPIKYTETYYNIYTYSDNPQINIKFIFNQNLINPPNPPPIVPPQPCKNNFINNNIILQILLKEKLLNLLLKIFNIFLKIFKQIQEKIKDNNNYAKTYYQFITNINNILRENNNSLQNLIYQFFYLSVNTNYNGNDIKNPNGAGNNRIHDIDNINKFIFWVFYFFNIKPDTTTPTGVNQNIYNIANFRIPYNKNPFNVQNNIIPFKNVANIIPYNIFIPSANTPPPPPPPPHNIITLPYSLDKFIIINDEQKLKLGENIIDIYNLLFDNITTQGTAITQANVKTITDNLTKIIKLLDKFIKDISVLLNLNNDTQEDNEPINKLSITTLKDLKKNIEVQMGGEEQSGGEAQKQEIENIMKQFIKNKKLKVQIENKIKDKKYNNLYYYVPIKLNLNEGTDKIGLNKKLEFSCNDNYDKIKKAWALLLGIEYIPSIPFPKEIKVNDKENAIEEEKEKEALIKKDKETVIKEDNEAKENDKVV